LPSPTFLSPGTSAFDGAGNRSHPRRRGRALGVADAKTIAGVRGSVRIRVAERGRLYWSGRGILAAKRTIGREGLYAIPIRLGSRALRSLKRRSAFVTTVRIRLIMQNGAVETARVVCTFRQRGRTARRSARIRDLGQWAR
jgi:hypothetical protein